MASNGTRSERLVVGGGVHVWRVLGVLWLLVSRMALLVVILQAYSWFRKTYFQRPAEVAYRHAEQLIDLQRALGIAVTRVELPLQAWVLERPWAIDVFNDYYRNMKPALYLAAVLCLLLAPVAFRRVWRVFLLATLIALPWYALYPLAPPRLMAEHGYPFVDTLAAFGGVQSSAGGVGGANQFAAMPSMHIGWSIVAALWLAAALPRRRLGALLGGLHVVLMSLAVIVTGNHFVLDIAGGIGVALLAVALERALRWVNVRERGIMAR